jgi:hypothetical protein
MDKPSTIDLALYVIGGLVTIGTLLVPLAWDKHKATAIWGLFLTVVLIELGAVLYWQKLELASTTAASTQQSDSAAGTTRTWRVFRVRDESGNISWNYSWTGIVWLGPEGWLCGSVNEGGGSGDVGRGVLLRSANQGSSWTEVRKDAFNSGKGRFKWGTRPYSWEEVGPIKTCRFFTRQLGGGKRRVEGWLAATTGIYVTRDGGDSWKRSTPRPDDTAYPVPFAHFENLVDVEQFSEVYAVGWQGIAHWSGQENMWTIQKTTGFYAIGGVSEFGGSENRSVWAGGMAGQDEQGNWGDRSHGAVYHLQWPTNEWKKVDLPGVAFSPGQSVADILVIDHQTIFAVGQKGLILRGSGKDHVWTWDRLNAGTGENLYSLTYDESQLWIVGERGTLLQSGDLGGTWRSLSLIDETGGLPTLRRIRFSNGVGWIVGDKVIYRSDSPTPH